MTEAKNAATDHDRAGLDKAYQRAIEEANQSEDEGQLPRAYAEYGTTLYKFGANEKAQKLLEKSVEVYQKLLADTRSTTDRVDVTEQLMKVRETLVAVLVAQDKLAAAEKVARANLDESRQAIGTFRLNNSVEELYLSVLKKAGKTKEAEEFQAEMDMNAIDENKHTLQNKASELIGAGKFDEAAKQLITNVKRMERRNPQEAAWSRERMDLLELLKNKKSGPSNDKDEEVLLSHQARLDEARQMYEKDKAKINHNYLARCLAIHGLLLLDKDAAEGKALIEQAIKIDSWEVMCVMYEYTNDMRAIAALSDPSKVPVERIGKLLKRLDTIYNTLQDCGLDKSLKQNDPTRYYGYVAAKTWTYAALEKNEKAIELFREYFKEQKNERNERNMGHFLHVLVRAHHKDEAIAQFKVIMQFEKERLSALPQPAELPAETLSPLIDIAAYGVDLKQTADAQFLIDKIKSSPYCGQLPPLRKQIFKAVQDRLKDQASNSAANNH